MEFPAVHLFGQIRETLQRFLPQVGDEFVYAEALWRLGKLPSHLLPDLAMTALQRGTEAESVVELAGYFRPIWSDVDRLWRDMLKSLSRGTMTEEDARHVLAVAFAKEVGRWALTCPRENLIVAADRLDDVRLEFYGVDWVGPPTFLDDFSRLCSSAVYAIETRDDSERLAEEQLITKRIAAILAMRS